MYIACSFSCLFIFLFSVAVRNALLLNISGACFDHKNCDVLQYKLHIHECCVLVLLQKKKTFNIPSTWKATFLPLLLLFLFIIMCKNSNDINNNNKKQDNQIAQNKKKTENWDKFIEKKKPNKIDLGSWFVYIFNII